MNVLKRPPSPARPAAVWVLVTGALLGSCLAVGASATSLASAAVWTGSFEDLLVALAAAALVTSVGWLWLITTLTVAELLSGRLSTAHGPTRRLVLMACGIAVVAGVSGPAFAGSGPVPTVSASDGPVLAGLPLPDRAVGSPTARSGHESRPAGARRPTVRRTPSAPTERSERVVVSSGDSLWSIARADLGLDATLREVDDRWRSVYAANRDEIGDDPDLISPGQRLLLPLRQTDQ